MSGLQRKAGFQLGMRALKGWSDPAVCCTFILGDFEQFRCQRTTEWFEFKGTLKIIKSQPPARGRNSFH